MNEQKKDGPDLDALSLSSQTTESLSECLRLVATVLGELSSGSSNADFVKAATRIDPGKKAVESGLIRVAMEELERADTRRRILPKTLQSEPIWLMLVDLFISERRKRSETVTSVCVASRMPDTTALRYLDALLAEGYIHRRADLCDKRKTNVMLSDYGRMTVAKILGEVAEKRRR